MDDWDDVWEQWDNEDCCDSAEDSGNFEFELQKENRKSMWHHRRGKGTTKKSEEKGNIVLKNIGNECTPGTLAGSPPLGGSNSLGLSSFEDRFSSLTTSCVSHTLAIKSNYLKSINTCDEEHPSVSGIISNSFHRTRVEC